MAGIVVTASPGKTTWSKIAGHSLLRVNIKNNDTVDRVLKSLTVRIALGRTSGKDSLKRSAASVKVNEQTIYGVYSDEGSLHTCTAASGTARLTTSSGKVCTAPVTKTASTEDVGYGSSVGGYFRDVQGDPIYNVKFTKINLTVKAGKDTYCEISSNSSDYIMTTRNSMKAYASCEQSRVGSPAKPSTPTGTSPVVMGNKINGIKWSAATGAEYRTLSFDGKTWSGWKPYTNGSVTVSTSMSQVEIRAYKKDTSYETSASYSNSLSLDVKHSMPLVSVSPSPVTIGCSVTAVGKNVNPGSTQNFSWYNSDGDKLSGSTSKRVADENGMYASLYVSSRNCMSSASSSSNMIVVYDYPRNMSSSGFTCNFKIDNIPISSLNKPVNPIFNLSVDWTSFDVEKNLGRFDSYGIQVFEEGSSTASKSYGGTNDPSKSNTFSQEVELLAGKKYYVKLSCKYRSSTTVADTAVFKSQLFSVGSPTLAPSILYPSMEYIYGHMSYAYTSNDCPPVIFNVGVDPNDENKGPTNIKVVISGSQDGINFTSGDTYYYDSSSSRFFGEVGPNTYVAFKLPEELLSSNKYVKCSLSTYTPNAGVYGAESVAVFSNYVISEVRSGELARLLGLQTAVSNTYYGWRRVLETLGLYKNSRLLTSSTRLIEKSYFINVLNDLISTYKHVISSVVDLNGPGPGPEESLVVEDNESFIARQGFQGDSGNYYNDIVYLLKYLL